jgi:hypothetical protein
MEINWQMCRVSRQDTLSTAEYVELMMDQIDEAPEGRPKALREIEKEKIKVIKAYNKRVREKSFQVRELVCKMILPVGMRCNKYGKWSPRREGPYRVIGIVPGMLTL